MEDLLSCCHALEDSCELLKETYQDMHSQTHEQNNEFPYVLKRFHQLLPEFDMVKTRLDAIEAVDPLVSKIETKIEQFIAKLQREKTTLQQTYELNRLREPNNSRTNDNDTVASNNSSSVVMTSTTPEELQKLKKLKILKEGLLKQIEDLNEQYK